LSPRLFSVSSSRASWTWFGHGFSTDFGSILGAKIKANTNKKEVLGETLVSTAFFARFLFFCCSCFHYVFLFSSIASCARRKAAKPLKSLKNLISFSMILDIVRCNVSTQKRSRGRPFAFFPLTFSGPLFSIAFSSILASLLKLFGRFLRYESE
jgi:hypothetical protein